MALVLALVVTVGAPAGQVPGSSSWSPWGWLRGLLVERASAAPLPGPRQVSGSASGKAGQVPASLTRAGTGRGRAAGKGVGQLPLYAPHAPRVGGQTRSRVGDGSHSFDPKTSRRIASAATETQDVYANADGTYSRLVHEGRVNFKAGNGVWTPIDTRLVRQPGGRYAVAANDVGVEVAGSAADTAVVTVSNDPGHQVAFGLQGAAAVPAVVAGDTATFPGVLAGTDLVESATADGVKEALVLHSASAPTSWLFPLHLNGLTPQLSADGSVQLVDAAGVVRQRIPHGFMQDSRVDPKSGLPAMSNAVTYALESVAGAPALRVSVDAAWLADPARVLPVTVDPTSTVVTSSTTYVEALVPGPHYTENQIESGTWDSGSHIARSVLGFTGFENTFAGQRMTSVSLSLFDSWATNCTSTTTFGVGQVTGNWSSATLANWPGPAIGGTTATPLPSIGSWSGIAPSVACGNTAGDRNVGGWVTTGPLAVSTFNSWIATKGGSNYGLAVFASETSSSQWKVFDSYHKAQAPYLTVTYTPDVFPQVDAQYPPDNYAATSLTPELLGYGHDPDNFPSPLQYQFAVYNSANALVVQSPLQASGSWVVPAGKLTWGQTYYWSVQTYDGYSYSSTAPRWYALSTPVPQPLVTSELSQNADGHGFEPSVGNYTTSATDADVATVGPALSVLRDYNSLDRRVGGAFGAGWSSLYDARATEVTDASGALQTVVVTYPEGQDVAFGRNADGSFTPPLGRFATLKAVTGGYTLTDKNDTVYTFTQSVAAGVYGITAVADGSGRREQFAYTGSQITQVTAASGRHLNLTWATPSGATTAHVASVSTDPATAGDATTTTAWTYAYTGDQLTSVCSPNSATACSAYTYAPSTLYPQTVLGGGPASYWRLGEAAGASRAASSVLANEGADNATYSNVTLGQPGSLPGSAATSAGFNGTNSSVELLNQLALGATYQSLAMRFKTSATNGVLFSYQADPITNGTTTGNYTPALYVGADGQLLGKFWDGNALTPMKSGKAVNDGAWHEVVLVGVGNTQTMYLDGQAVATVAGQITLLNGLSTSHVYVGAGFLGSVWPDQTRSPSTGMATYFNGSISDVAFYTRPLTAPAVAALAGAGQTQANVLTGVKRPSGNTYAQVGYDTATGRVTQVTDGNGATWALGAPTVTGSSQVYVGAVLGAGPRDYWRFGEQTATDAVNQVNGDTLTYTGGVTLGTAGPFTDATAATFDGTGYANAATPLIVGGGNQSISLWFKTSTGGGVLASYHADPLSNGTSSGNFVPMLYVGTDGRLRGEYWDGNGSVMTSPGTVTDGKWHHVVLAAGTGSQVLYLDNTQVGTKTGTVDLYNSVGANHSEIGGGFASSGWPAMTGSIGTATYFNGSISDVAIFRSQLSAAQVNQQYTAARASTGLMPAMTVNVTDPGGHTVRYVSDPVNGNRPLAQTDALGNTTQYGYDSSGFLNTVTDPNGNVVTTGHDVRGNIVSQVTCQVRASNTCSTAYYTYYPDDTSPSLTPDPRNDLLLTRRDGRSASSSDNTYLTSYAYDANGNRTGVTTPPVLTGNATTPAARTTTTTYTTTATAAVGGGTTPAGLPASLTTPGGAVTTLGYYADGDLAQVTDPVGLVTTYTYDNLGRQLTKTVVSDTYPAGLTTSYAYDKNGQVVTETAPAVTDRVTGAVHTPRPRRRSTPTVT
jgi:YD repeat-containing protein